MNVFSQKLRVEYSEERQALLIINPEVEVNSGILVEIRIDTLKSMDFDQAALFLGQRLLLLIPEMRELFKQYLKDCP